MLHLVPYPCQLPPCKEDNLLDFQLNFFEFNVDLESNNDGLVSGMDGIDCLFLKALPIKHKLILLEIFNEMYRDGEFPDDWFMSFVNFLPNSDGIGVRPISLISCT